MIFSTADDLTNPNIQWSFSKGVDHELAIGIGTTKLPVVVAPAGSEFFLCSFAARLYGPSSQGFNPPSARLHLWDGDPDDADEPSEIIRAGIGGLGWQGDWPGFFPTYSLKHRQSGGPAGPDHTSLYLTVVPIENIPADTWLAHTVSGYWVNRPGKP